MKTFTKTIRRSIAIRGSTFGLPNREWILLLDADGLSFREAGRRGGARYRLPWRAVLGLGLVTGARAREDSAATATTNGRKS